MVKTYQKFYDEALLKYPIGVRMSDKQPSWTDIISAIGVVIASIIAVGGILWAMIRGYFMLEKRFDKLDNQISDNSRIITELISSNKLRLDMIDALIKDLDHRLNTLEAVRKNNE